MSGEWSQAPSYTYPREKGIIFLTFTPPSAANPADFTGYWNFGLDTPPKTLQYAWYGHKTSHA